MLNVQNPFDYSILVLMLNFKSNAIKNILSIIAKHYFYISLFS